MSHEGNGKRRSFWERLRKLWRDQGAAGLWFTALALSVYRRMHAFELRLDEPIAENVPRVQAEIRPLLENDEASYLAMRPEDVGKFLPRLKRGDQCWGAWCEGDVRHVCWVAFRDAWIDYLARPMPLGDDEGFVHGLYTHPAWRRFGLSPARATFMMRALRDRGYKRVLMVTLPENRLVRAPLLQAGYRRIGTLGYVRVGPWRHHFYRPIPGSALPGGFTGLMG